MLPLIIEIRLWNVDLVMDIIALHSKMLMWFLSIWISEEGLGSIRMSYLLNEKDPVLVSDLCSG
jgi:hypothetical protein